MHLTPGMVGDRAISVSLLLAGAMCLLPFLVPWHQQPLLSFYSEWLAGALALGAMCAAYAGRRFVPVPLSSTAKWLLAFGAYLLLRAVIERPAYPQMTFWAITYVACAAAVMWLGSYLARGAGRRRAAMVIAAFLLAGAVANALAGIVQFYGRPNLLEDFVAVLRGDRAYGNIAQPTLFANYLALGEAALLYLWIRGRLSGAACGALAVVIVWGCAVSASRIALLDTLWFVALSYWTRTSLRDANSRRLFGAACALAAGAMASYLLLPSLHGAVGLGPAQYDVFDRLRNTFNETRWQAWALALRVFARAPLLGAGIGEFAGAAFESGIPDAMTAEFPVWTSPHNVLLHLLAETGALGTGLVLVAWIGWWMRALARKPAVGSATRWWVTASVGIELIDSMLQFPLWNAHFLLVTALLVGIGSPISGQAVAKAQRYRGTGIAFALALAGALVVALRSYWNLDLTRVTGTPRALERPTSSRDAEILIALGSGPLGPIAELWRCLGATLSRQDLDAKLELSKRVMRYWPSPAIATRRAIFLALAGQGEQAASLIGRVGTMVPKDDFGTIRLLREAESADPAAIGPLLSIADARLR